MPLHLVVGARAEPFDVASSPACPAPLPIRPPPMTAEGEKKKEGNELVLARLHCCSLPLALSHQLRFCRRLLGGE